VSAEDDRLPTTPVFSSELELAGVVTDCRASESVAAMLDEVANKPSRHMGRTKPGRTRIGIMALLAK
jgi:hypothetical protein